MRTFTRRHTVSTAAPAGAPDLVVFSHVRWSWVWQRPQQLISRLATTSHTWFIEEPLIDTSLDAPCMTWSTSGQVTVGCLHLPGPQRRVGFEDPAAGELFCEVAAAAAGTAPILWLFTPHAYPAAAAIDHRLLVLDVMDDLPSSGESADHGTPLHGEVLRQADVVFTGGRSLHHQVMAHRPEHTYLFPSGVETEHYAAAAARRAREARPVAGYVGVIDERVDLDLLAALADLLPSWIFRMVGPVARIHPSALPQRSNIQYVGPVSYARLPGAMAGFDIALIPFACNEATQWISPTKTLEYLAAGLPVVSTALPDVVHDFGHIVRIAETAIAFANGCVDALAEGEETWYAARCQQVLEGRHWDGIAHQMAAIMSESATPLISRPA